MISTLLKLVHSHLILFSFCRKKLNWTGDLALRSRAEAVFKTEMDKMADQVAPTSAPPPDQDDEVFVTFGTTVEKEPETKQYLDSPTTPTLDSLALFPKVRSLFAKNNTTLPSSASVERLFSNAGLILTPLRCRVSDKNFEAKVL